LKSNFYFYMKGTGGLRTSNKEGEAETVLT